MPVVLWPNGSASMPHVTSEYNPARRNPVTGIIQPHGGIDLTGWSTIVAPVDGVVTFAGYNGGAGNEVRIRADGPNAFVKGDTFRMLHNRELWVRTGQRVSQGQGVAVMGTTGNSTGVHCHFETRPGGGAAINPRSYMASRNAGTSGGGSSEEDWDMATADQVLAAVNNLSQLLVGVGASIDDPKWAPGANSIMGTVRNIAGFVYAGGTSTGDPNYVGSPGTLYALAKTPVERQDAKGNVIRVSQIQELADAKTVALRTEQKVDALTARPAATISAAHVEQIATLLREQLGKPTVTLDYSAIAKAVNDDAARRLAS
ncbi:MAG: M23 family metallopeptidase [Microbacterium sp.]